MSDDTKSQSPMPLAAGESKRVYRRIAIQGNALVHNEKALYLAPIANISGGGVFVSKLVQITEGSMVRLVIRSPKLAQPVTAHGKIVRVAPDGAAVVFTEISHEDRQAILMMLVELETERMTCAA